MYGAKRIEKWSELFTQRRNHISGLFKNSYIDRKTYIIMLTAANIEKEVYIYKRLLAQTET